MKQDLPQHVIDTLVDRADQITRLTAQRDEVAALLAEGALAVGDQLAKRAERASSRGRSCRRTGGTQRDAGGTGEIPGEPAVERAGRPRPARTRRLG